MGNQHLFYKIFFLAVCVSLVVFMMNLESIRDQPGIALFPSEEPVSPQQLRTYYINNNAHRRLGDGEPEEVIAEHPPPEKSDTEQQVVVEEQNSMRTATGGFVYVLLFILTMVAFIGNGAFLVNVFWLSK